MAKKKKSKLKKFLKGAALAGAAALGASALGRRGRGLGVSGANKRAFTTDAAYMDDTMPGNLSRNMGMNRREFMPGIQDYMSKGGRVGVGKAKRGFGRAMKKGRK